jgi:hypothetical protein
MHKVSMEHAAAASAIAGMAGVRSLSGPPNQLLKKEETAMKQEERVMVKTSINDSTTKEGEDPEEDPLYVTQLRSSDVLLGRGTGPNNHPGNVDFRLAVEELKRGYVATASRKAKKRLVQNAVRSVQEGKKGRFLSKLSKSELKRLKLSQPKRYERQMAQAPSSSSSLLSPTVATLDEDAKVESSTSTNTTNGAAASSELVPFYQIVSDEVAMEKTKQALRYVCYKRDARSGSPSSSHLLRDEEEEDNAGDEEEEGDSKTTKISSKGKKEVLPIKKTSSPKKKSDKKRKSSAVEEDARSLQSSSLASSSATKPVTNSIGSFLSARQQKSKRQLAEEVFQGRFPSESGNLSTNVTRSMLFGGGTGFGGSTTNNSSDLGGLLSSALLSGNTGALPSWATDAAVAGYSQQQILDRAERIISSALSNAATMNYFRQQQQQQQQFPTSLLHAATQNPFRSNTPSSTNGSSSLSLEQELLLAEALRRQVHDQRLFALQQHFMG